MPAASPRKRRPSLPGGHDDHLTVEVIKGVTLMSPRPAPTHASAALALRTTLCPAFDDHYRNRKSGRPPAGPGGWRILPEPELRLRGDTLCSDLAAWRTSRLPTLPKTAYIAVAPDWVCEVLSPSTQSIDRFTKLPAYAAAGVQSVWLVAVAACTLEVYRLAGDTYELVATHGGDRRVRVEPFAELLLELATIWP